MSEYPPCKYCGASHGMGIENRETEEIEPIDICHDCLFKEGYTYKPVEEKIIMLTEEDLEREFGNLLIEIVKKNYGKNE